MDVYAVGNGMKSIPISSIPNWAEFGGELAMPWAAANGKPKLPIELMAWVGFLHRAIDLRANAVSSLPWAVYRQSSDDPLWDSETPTAPDMLAALMDMPALFYRTEAALCLGGRAYWFKERNRVRVTTLRWLDPATMAPQWTPAGLSHFTRSANNDTRRMEVDDVVYFWLQGLSETDPRPAPAQAAANAANVIFNSAEFAKAYFARGAIKAGLLTVDGQPLPAERERLKNWWTRFMGGIGNAFNAEVVSASVNYVPIGEGLAELTNQALTEEQRTDIATALGVPHSLIMSNSANYATAKQDAQTFYETTVVPAATAMERVINRQLMEQMGLRFEFRPQALDVFQQDEKERAGAFAAYVNAGLKPSIVAQMLGLELPDGVAYEDLDPEPQPIQLVAASQNGTEPENGEEDQARQIEMKRLRNWAKKRKAPAPAAFKSDILSDAEKEAVLAEMRGPFPVEWAVYP